MEANLVIEHTATSDESKKIAATERLIKRVQKIQHIHNLHQRLIFYTLDNRPVVRML